MNAGVALAQAYLHLNGFLTQAEVSVIREGKQGAYQEVTDLDLLGVRFPWAAAAVSRGGPGPEDDLVLEPDPRLGLSDDGVDAIIGEVKEGEARLNDAMRSPEVLSLAVRRLGCCPASRVQGVVEQLRARGEAHVKEPDALPMRIRLLAFGGGQAGKRHDHTVVSLTDVAAFVRSYLHRYHQVLHPAALGDPVLGLLHLLRKLEKE